MNSIQAWATWSPKLVSMVTIVQGIHMYKLRDSLPNARNNLHISVSPCHFPCSNWLLILFKSKHSKTLCGALNTIGYQLQTEQDPQIDNFLENNVWKQAKKTKSKVRYTWPYCGHFQLYVIQGCGLAQELVSYGEQPWWFTEIDIFKFHNYK